MQKLKIVERLQNELTVLRRELNIELPRMIEEARAHGDLKENACLLYTSDAADE